MKVSEAEKYCFKLTNDLLRRARIQVVTCEHLWSVEISSGQWNQYSNKNIELIENAYMKKLSHVLNFTSIDSNIASSMF